MNFWIDNGETMLFIGDSITDCGRRAAEAPLGIGYVRLFTEMVTAAYPDRGIRYINKGIGGNRVTDLRDRWTDDVFYHAPDKLSIKIGINDLHSVLRGAPEPVPPDRFASIYDALLSRTRDTLNCPIVLLSPFYISRETTSDSFRQSVLSLIPEYIEVVERLSETYGTRLVRLHDIFQKHLEYRDSETFCPEPVHPNRAGHLVIAKALFDVLLEGSIRVSQR